MRKEILSFSLGNVRRLEWYLRLRCDPGKVSAFTGDPVDDGGMGGDSIIPDYDRLWLPSNPCLVVDTTANVVQQELEQIVALLLFEPIDAASDCIALAWGS